MGKQLQALAEACLTEGNPRQIHRLRVVLRRFRFWVRVGKPWLPTAPRERFEAWGRRVAALTAEVRDRDAAHDWLRSKRAGAGILRGFEVERTTAWRKQRRRMRPLTPEMLDRLGVTAIVKEGGRRLRRRIRKLEQRFEDELARDLPRFFKLGPAEQHEVRRVVRRWRYLREMVASPAEKKRDRMLGALLEVQDTVGNRQNLQLAMDFLEKRPPVGKPLVRLLRSGREARQQQVPAVKKAIRRLQRELD